LGLPSSSPCHSSCSAPSCIDMLKGGTGPLAFVLDENEGGANPDSGQNVGRLNVEYRHKWVKG
jgi:hypothetical protein